MERRKLTRSTRNNVIGGVCAGLGEYFNIDPVIFRVIFIALALGAGAGVVLYLVLWLIIPDEDRCNYSRQMQNRQNPDTAPQHDETGNNNGSAEDTGEESRKDENSKRTTNNTSAYVIGICFIVLGVFFLFNNFFHLSFSKLWPLILIEAGVGMIISYLQKTKR